MGRGDNGSYDWSLVGQCCIWLLLLGILITLIFIAIDVGRMQGVIAPSQLQAGLQGDWQGGASYVKCGPTGVPCFAPKICCGNVCAFPTDPACAA